MVNGKASGATKLLRRTSAGSSPTSAANRSIARSTVAVASGRPAPRKASVGTVLVTTERACDRILGMAYTPLAMCRVKYGRNAPICG